MSDESVMGGFWVIYTVLRFFKLWSAKWEEEVSFSYGCAGSVGVEISKNPCIVNKKEKNIYIYNPDVYEIGVYHMRAAPLLSRVLSINSSDQWQIQLHCVAILILVVDAVVG